MQSSLAEVREYRHFKKDKNNIGEFGAEVDNLPRRQAMGG